ncbi:MAG: hypothetical protein L0191_04405 [Acidobacteria bacterium]|nr:hypothetical protein [Acidobacteriota bacterium]
MDSSAGQIEELLAEGIATAKAEEVKARHAFERAQRALSVWNRLHDYHVKGWHAHIVAVFTSEAGFFQELRASNDARASQLAAFHRVSEEAARVALKRFPADLERACEVASIALDRTSRHPHYTIRNFIVMEINEAKLSARITPRDGAPIDVPVDIPAIIEQLTKQHDRLFRREFEPSRFLASLFTAYQAVVREDERRMGDEIPIRRVVHRMGKNLANFSLDEFNADLGRAIREGHVQTEDHRLQLGHTRNTRQGMLLQGLEESGYVGFISFRKG